MLNRKIAALAVSAGLALAAGPALAAQSTTSLNVRSGPGTGYSVVDVLYEGEEVDVRECNSSGWCRITHSGPDGWVSRNYLTDIGGAPSRSADTDGPSVSFSFGTPNFSFSVGNGRPSYRGPGSPVAARVCFYEDFNYRGASFCVRPGQQDRRLGSWNDRISSIRVSGNATVQVCEDWNFSGRCATISGNRAALTGRNNDVISSYRVR